MAHFELHLAQPVRAHPTPIRWILGALLAFGALNAFGGGWYGLQGARGVPLEWLAGSPFKNYFVPGLVLFAVVGGSLLAASVAVLARTRRARHLAVAAGVIVLGWLAVQVAIIGYVSWMQPVTAGAGVLVLALARLLPDAKRAPSRGPSFGSYYTGVIRRPGRTFEALLSDARRLRLGTLALLSNAALYTLVYVFLVIGHGRPTVFKPWLAIEPGSYYLWNVFLLAPSMVMAWIVASGVAQLLARRFGGKGTFEDTLSVLGFGAAIASWWTLLHDLVTTCLGALHVMDQRVYEDAMSSPTPFRTLLWMLMLGYLVTFLILFSKGLAASQHVRRGPAAALGAVAFVTYQLIFVVFNR